jgi:hypothetical protein
MNPAALALARQAASAMNRTSSSGMPVRSWISRSAGDVAATGRAALVAP